MRNLTEEDIRISEGEKPEKMFSAKDILQETEASPDLSERYKRPIGILKGKASYKIRDDFKITDEELLYES